MQGASLTALLTLCSTLLHSFLGFSVDSPQPSPSSQKSQLSLGPELQASLSTAEQGSSPVLSPVLSGAGTARMDNPEEQKHKVGHS